MRRLIPFLGLFLSLISSQAHGRPTTPDLGILTVEFLDVGQGDAILVRSPEGKTALIDAGPSHDVVPLLRARGVNAIDMVCVSHHHADHYGGMEAVIREYRPRVFLATDSSHASPQYLRLLRLVRDGGMQAIFPASAPRTLGLGSVNMTVLPQPPENRRDENENSIGIRVQYGTFSVLLTGDSEARERAYWERYVPGLVRDCTVLKLAHHGGRNGTDTRWLALVRPRLAVASLGRDNDFGHPHPETLAVLDRLNIPLLRTDRDGTVTAVSDGKEWGESVSGPSPRRESQPGRIGHRFPPASDPKPPHRVIDINSASQVELEALPGIGPTIARRIIEGRPYRSVDGLRKVKGIGEARLAEIRRYVRVR